MDKLWVVKYQPSNINNILLPQKSISLITDWIENLKTNKNKILLLYGPPGVGKTTLANIILSQYNYDIIEFNTSDVRNQKLIKEKLNEIFNKQNILGLMNKDSKKIGIIMDELDGISSGERSGITEFLNLINPKKNKFSNPIVCTTNSISEKKIKEVMKHSLSIKISKPNQKDLMKLIETIEKEEKINIPDEQKLLLIKKSQFDFRRLVNMMQFIYNGDNQEKDYMKIIKNYKEKDLDHLLFDSVEKILNRYNYNDIILSYNSDKNLISMLIYENFLYEIILNCNETYEKKVINISKIFNNFSIADNLDNQIMVNHNFDLAEFCGFNKCVVTSFLINNMKKKTFKKHNEILFSKLLNRSSLEYLNYKSLDNILNIFNLHCSTYIHQIFSDFISYLLLNKDTYDIGINILKSYNYDLKKIDKILNYSINKEKAKKLKIV